MRHPRLLLVLVLILSSSPLSAAQLGRISVGPPNQAAEGEKVLQPIRADIKVNAEGVVTAVRMDSGVPSFLTEPFERALTRWQILPAQVKGVPYDWATRVSVWLVAETRENGVAFKVHDVELTTAWYGEGKRFRVPAYPPSMRRSGNGANVVMLVTPDEGGKRNRILSALIDGQPAHDANPFLRSVREAVREWPVVVLEWDGMRYADDICVPVAFSVGKDPAERSNAETEADCRRLPGSSYEEGDEEIRLAEDVRGQLL